MNYHVPPANLVNVSVFGNFTLRVQWMQSNRKATQTFKCRLLPPANDFGHRCETGKSLNFLSIPSNGAAEVSSFRERRVDLYGSIFNFPV